MGTKIITVSYESFLKEKFDEFGIFSLNDQKFWQQATF